LLEIQSLICSCSWAPGLGSETHGDEAGPQQGDWKHQAVKNAKFMRPVTEEGRESLTLQLGGQDHPAVAQALSSAPEAAYVFYPMSVGKLVGSLRNAKTSSTLSAAKLHGSYSHLPAASLHFFSCSGPVSTRPVKRSTIPFAWQLGGVIEIRELGIGQAWAHTFICKWMILPLEQYPRVPLPVFVAREAAAFAFSHVQTHCVSNTAAWIGLFS